MGQNNSTSRTSRRSQNQSMRLGAGHSSDHAALPRRSRTAPPRAAGPVTPSTAASPRFDTLAHVSTPTTAHRNDQITQSPTPHRPPAAPRSPGAPLEEPSPQPDAVDPGTTTPIPTASAPSRAIRSTTRRRRLLAAFYPLLSRNSSSRNNSEGGDSASAHQTSFSSNSNSNNNRSSSGNGVGEGRTISPTRHRSPELPRAQGVVLLRSHTPQPTSAVTTTTPLPSTPSGNARTPRGLSRVQRMYDEQSIRSNRSSSSRSSSLFVTPSSSSSTQPQTPFHGQVQSPPSHVLAASNAAGHPHHQQIYYERLPELMDIDQTTYSGPAHSMLDSASDTAHLQRDRSTSVQPTSLAQPATNSLSLASHATPTSIGSGLDMHAAGSMGMSQGSRQDANHVRFSGLYMGLSNPRGGTSISSSLLPIRPDSEDEDDYEAMTSEIDDHSQRSQRRGGGNWRSQADDGGSLRQGDAGSISSWHHPSVSHHDHETGLEGHGSSSSRAGASGPGTGAGLRVSRTGEPRPRPSRPSRYPPPEIVADLIHRQIAQGLAETAAAAAATAAAGAHPTSTEPSPQPNSSTTSLETVNNSTFGGSLGEGSTSANSSTVGARSDTAPSEEAFVHRGSRVHQRRLRSSSLRGLLGFQPMGGVMTEERLTGSGSESRSSLDQQTDTPRPESAVDGMQFVDNQVPFFTRLLADLGRGLRGSAVQGADGDRSITGPASASASAAITSPESTGTSSASRANTATLNNFSARASTMPSAGSTNTMINDHGPPPRPRRHTTIRFIQVGGSDGLSGMGRRARSGSVGSAQEATRRDRSEDLAQEDITDAIIMFLSHAGSGSTSEAESSETTETDTARARSRRSPWVVLTLSGAYLSSLLAGAGTEGEEGGMSYDDLWMLSNLIGPARPITTTQEAIDNAGFHVGQFENASQGMRDYSMLGDGSKCLVCMSEYEEGEDMRALRCKHGFHQECIDKWLTTGANKCPVCRAAAVVPRDPVADPFEAPGPNALAAEP
ncbi:hypothetical protein BGZ70_003594 [Mortierella alpina]|uniref:RING-type domain-containing protein n=1 Tax=Mortierella alpina TaxID=64518 RepID=A0A9P6JEP8_MORAP|nr:hypothetical protein BGZ70_003594 [Mortierella alpina]